MDFARSPNQSNLKLQIRAFGLVSDFGLGPQLRTPVQAKNPVLTLKFESINSKFPIKVATAKFGYSSSISDSKIYRVHTFFSGIFFESERNFFARNLSVATFMRSKCNILHYCRGFHGGASSTISQISHCLCLYTEFCCLLKVLSN